MMSTTIFPPLAPENIRALDQLRQRLSQLSTSLGALKLDLERNEPLPSWPSLQSSAQILSHNLNQLLSTFETHRSFFNAAHAYPLTSFPGHNQEPLLNQLLRKRLEPVAEDWIKGFANATDTVGPNREQINGTDIDSHGNLPEGEVQQLWAFAGPASNAIVKRLIQDEAFADDFTIAEREEGVENIVTGLKRKLWEEEDDDGGDEEGDEKMEDVIPAPTQPSGGRPEANGFDSGKPALPLDSVLKAMSTGITPAS